jgi:hypothetical protein
LRGSEMEGVEGRRRFTTVERASVPRAWCIHELPKVSLGPANGRHAIPLYTLRTATLKMA